MHIVLVQSDEIREADFIKEMLEGLKFGRQKYAGQSIQDMAAIFDRSADAFRQLAGTPGAAIQTHKAAIDLAVMALRIMFDTDFKAPEDFFAENFSNVTEDDVSEMFEEYEGLGNDHDGAS